MKRWVVKCDIFNIIMYDGFKTTLWIYHYSDGEIETVKLRVKL